MERGASGAKAADKSETGSGSSSEVAIAAPPEPERESKEEIKHYHSVLLISLTIITSNHF